MSYSEHTSKTPSEAFPKCPACLTTCLTHKGRHVYCQVCDWSSREAYRRREHFDSARGAKIMVAVTCRPRSEAPVRIA